MPLARFTIPELLREVLARGIVAQISGVTLSRRFSADALQPRRHRSWIFPRDLQFSEKVGRILDLHGKTAWDVHRAKLFGRCEPKTTIGAVDRLIEQVMAVEPYRSARRVFWITDNCSSQRGESRHVPSNAMARRNLGPHP